MMRIARCLAFGLFASWTFLGVALPVSAQTASQQREAAVAKARAGQMAEAQGALRDLLSAGIDDGLVAMDLTALLQQDGKSAEAIAVFEKAARLGPPEYALLAATRAYRDVRRFADAVRLARDGMRRFPANSTWPLLLSVTLSDDGQPKEALAILAGPGAAKAPPVERLLAEGYAHRKARDPFAAMKSYAEAMRLAPASAAVRVEAAAVLQEMGAPYGAAMIAGVTPSIAADQAAAMVRWGSKVRSPEPAQRFVGTDAALARLDALLSSTPPENTRLRRQLRLDRVAALRDRVRMAEAAEEAALLRTDSALPPYAEEAYADALLYLKRPKEALEAYERVLAQNPRDIPARYGKFFASVELEDFSTAYTTVDGLVAEQPIWPSYRQDRTRYDNTDRTYAELTAAQGRFFGDQLADAWARITQMSDAAPANGLIRLTAFQIASARGWPRRAEVEAQIAASLEPRNVETGIALIEVEMANYRFAEAQKLLNELIALYPENVAVQHLARELDAKRRWLLELEASPSNTTGGGPNASGQGLLAKGTLYTPPIDDHWRLFAFGDYANAHPPEGYAELIRAGFGAEWRGPSLTATLYPSQTWGTLSRFGGGATVAWAVTDQVLLSAAAEAFSIETPLRALLAGVSSDQVSARAAYRWHESRSVMASVAYQPFTDGNQRLNGGLTYLERLVDVPHFDLTGRATAFTSSNTLANAPYYNPARDLALTGGLIAEHVVWRRYDNSLVQALSLDAGLYSEQGFNDNWIGTARYEHRWRFDPLTELRYGVSLTRRVYDGEVENGIALMISLRQRI